MAMKWSVFLTNLVAFLLGLTTFGITIWIRFDLDFKEWVREIDWYVR